MWICTCIIFSPLLLLPTFPYIGETSIVNCTSLFSSTNGWMILTSISLLCLIINIWNCWGPPQLCLYKCPTLQGGWSEEGEEWNLGQCHLCRHWVILPESDLVVYLLTYLILGNKWHLVTWNARVESGQSNWSFFAILLEASLYLNSPQDLEHCLGPSVDRTHPYERGLMCFSSSTNRIYFYVYLRSFL